ncbi:glycosyltransferase [uncultured Methanobrevibacter sp.]|uniref:glycosyltransferase n=1 Tax=uncultured Methanobrevibacter sp. TaxID=253161 RepID=UPI0025CF0DC6|nr:glycosyltransferase [uncultured Methanobrevibacter sp.]
MNEKISIILPIFNVGPHLKGGIDSLINQTIGNENLEIIMVNDCSTDGSDKIIDEYAEKYDCCVAIHHETNSGGAHTPRNTGIEASTGDYIMFLDPDDRYVPDACEKLYNTLKEYDVDLAFARFRRIFEYGGYVQESYSPYKADLESAYPDETFKSANFLDIPDVVWDNVVERALYGKTLEVTYPRDKPIDIIHVDNIEQEPDLLKIQPSVWCKIYKRELIMDNNLRFKKYVTGDDMAFTLEALLHAKGIVYLNNYFSYDYYIRDLPDDKSITNNVNVRLLDELMEAYIYCRKQTEGFSTDVQNVSINPHLLHWMHTWKTSPFTKSENKLLLSKVKRLKKIHNGDIKTRMLMSSMTTALESKIFISKE